ncbi:HIT domain-containing protein [Nocardioides alcanivorans]|uniref:HIT domain-containing protein n=1 Tax=Nocardioides alcanivorans TaxID=2897352 RepID=UPI001F23A8C8|nr:HIT domain-containing protein [Nocardioides alcanivorans]
MSASTDCIFCKIAAGEIPGDIVGETELSVAFRDLMPQAPTHVLVVPRGHHENAAAVAEAAPDTLADMFLLARTVAEQEALEGYRAVFNTGAAAQQTVFHAHLHVIGGRPFTWPPG